MKEIHELSENSKYIDMQKQVEADIGLFYLSANRLNEGIQFYERLGKDISSHLYKLGKSLINRKRPSEAIRLLAEAKKGLGKEKAIDINLTLLSIFMEYGKYNKHIKTSKELFPLAKKGDLEDSQVEVYLFQLKKMGGILQKHALAKTNKKSLQKKAKLAGEYFDLLAEMIPKERGKYLYLKAETYYATKMMGPALKAYQESFEYEKSKRRSKQMKLSLEGMLAALASPSLPKTFKEKYHISTYNAYLKIDRKSKRADTIYQRIFQKYFDKKDLKNVENVLRSYKANFPGKLSTQEAMVAKIMDYHRKSGNKEAFSEWVMKIKNKEYYVSKKYGQQLSTVLLAMRFNNVEKAASTGNKKRALEGYLNIYEDSKSRKESKRNAAHNITVLYFELGYADQTFMWAERSISLMTPKELAKLAKTYLTISSELFSMQRFDKSAKLSENIYRKICQQKTKYKNDLYKNSYIIYLASNKLPDARRVISSGERCNVPSRVRNEAQLEILKILGEQRKWKMFESQLYKVRKIPSLRGEVIGQMALLRDTYREFLEKGRANQLEKDMEAIYNQARKYRQNINVSGLWEIAKIKLRKMESLVEQFNKIRLQFPQKKFDALLERKFDLLNKLATEAEKVFQTKSGRGSIKAYQLIIESYQQLVKEIREFKVVGKKPAYIATFKRAMKQIETPLLKKSLSYLQQARRLINGGKVLSPDSYWFISRNRIPFDVKYQFSGNGILMDRRGKR